MHNPPDNTPLDIPPFLKKLVTLVDDPDTDHLICWNDAGQSFIILDTICFTKELLPRYYKHNNLASFIRQLNMYGFHKIVSIESGNLESKGNVMEFYHPYFIREHPYLLENIQRKMTNRSIHVPATLLKGINESDMASSEMMARLLADVNEVKKKQTGWDQKIAAMKRENESLWRELAIFRQKHQKQEQIINRLIQFIVTVVRPTARSNHVPLRRRRYQLMLDGSKQPSTSSGPTIRELDPVEQFLTETGTSYKSGWAKPNESKSHSDCEEPAVFDSPTEYVETPSDPTYVVLSPEASDPGSVPTTWLLEESDGDDAAMTPINPYDVTPVPVTIIKPAAFKPPPNPKNTKTNKLSLKSQSRVLPVISVNPPKRVVASSSKATVLPNNSVKKAPAFVGTLDLKTNAGKAAAADKRKIKGRKQKLPKSTIKKKAKKENTAEKQTDEAHEIDDAILKEAMDLITGDEKKKADKPMEFGQEEGNLAIVRPSNNAFSDDLSRYVQNMDLGNHVDQVQGDIDILKELLKGDNYNLDANTLLELFNEDPMNLIMSNPDGRGSNEENEGQELMAYNTPNLVDLADMYVGTPAMDGLRGSPSPASHPASPAPSGLQTPIFVPSSPCFPSATKKRRKQ